MQCKYVRNGTNERCQRKAVKGWTMCARHHSAGRSTKQHKG